MLAKNCGKTVEELEQLTLGGDLVLDAQQAVEFGIVDAVLTKEVIDRLNNADNPEIIVPEGSGNDKEDEEKPEDTNGEMEYKNNENYSNSFLNLEIKAVKDEGGFSI